MLIAAASSGIKVEFKTGDKTKKFNVRDWRSGIKEACESLQDQNKSGTLTIGHIEISFAGHNNKLEVYILCYEPPKIPKGLIPTTHIRSKMSRSVILEALTQFTSQHQPHMNTYSFPGGGTMSIWVTSDGLLEISSVEIPLKEIK